MIPFSVADKLIAFLGPYPTPNSHPEIVQSFFLFFSSVAPSAFEKYALDMKFMDPFARVFRLAPAPDNKEYLAWLDNVQSQHQKQWED